MQAYITARADASKVASDIAKDVPTIEGVVKGMTDRINGILGTIGVGFGLMKIIGMFQKGDDAADAYDLSVEKLRAVMNVAGKDIGFSADQLEKWVDKAAEAATVSGSGNEVRAAATGLMRFDKLRGDMFRRALEASADLSVAFGSIEGASMSLGMAMQDPVAGVNRLRRSGIMLTDAQKEEVKGLMKRGELLKAQGIIMKVVEAKSKGLAKAMGETDIGKEMLMDKELAKLEIAMGSLWGPVDILGKKIKIGFYEAVVKVGKAVKWFVTQLGEFNDALGGIPGKLAMATAGVLVFHFVVRQAISGITKAFAMNPFGMIIVGVAAAIAGIALLVKYFADTKEGMAALKYTGEAIAAAWEKIKFVVKTVWDVLVGMFSGVTEDVAGMKEGAIGMFSALVMKAGDLATYLSDKLIEWAPYFIAGLKMAKDLIVSIGEFFKSVWEVAVYYAVSLWDYFKSYVGSVFDYIVGIISPTATSFSSMFAGAFSTILANLNTMLGSWAGLREGILNVTLQTVYAFQALWESAKNFVLVKLIQMRGLFINAWYGLGEKVMATLMAPFARFFLWFGKNADAMKEKLVRTIHAMANPMSYVADMVGKTVAQSLTGVDLDDDKKKMVGITPEEEAVIQEDLGRTLGTMGEKRKEKQRGISKAIEDQEKRHQEAMAKIGMASLEQSEKWKKFMGENPTLTGKFKEMLGQAMGAMPEFKLPPKPGEKPGGPKVPGGGGLGKEEPEMKELEGRIAFPDLGKKIQDAMIKGQDTMPGLMAEQVGLSKYQRQLQERIAKAVEANKGGGLG
jgi:hypothetical protein